MCNPKSLNGIQRTSPHHLWSGRPGVLLSGLFFAPAVEMEISEYQKQSLRNHYHTGTTPAEIAGKESAENPFFEGQDTEMI